MPYNFSMCSMAYLHRVANQKSLMNIFNYVSKNDYVWFLLQR